MWCNKPNSITRLVRHQFDQLSRCAKSSPRKRLNGHPGISAPGGMTERLQPLNRAFVIHGCLGMYRGKRVTQPTKERGFLDWLANLCFPITIRRLYLRGPTKQTPSEQMPMSERP